MNEEAMKEEELVWGYRNVGVEMLTAASCTCGGSLVVYGSVTDDKRTEAVRMHALTEAHVAWREQMRMEA